MEGTVDVTQTWGPIPVPALAEHVTSGKAPLLGKVLFSVKWSPMHMRGDQGGRLPDVGPRSTIFLTEGSTMLCFMHVQYLRVMRLVKLD